MTNSKKIKVIGAGLAGCEAAWQAVKQGVEVDLYEMKPTMYTPAHHSDKFAELVCSNSLRSNQLNNAVGLLKEELRRLGKVHRMYAPRSFRPQERKGLWHCHLYRFRVATQDTGRTDRQARKGRGSQRRD